VRGGVIQLTDMAAVRKVVDRIPDARVMADLDALLPTLKATPKPTATAWGVTGFCRGGMYTLLFAAHSRADESGRAVVRTDQAGQDTGGPHGGAPRRGEEDRLSRSSVCTVGADQGIPVEDVKEMEAALKAAGKTCEFTVYPGAPHAFFADYRPSYRAEAAKDAWAGCVAWFRKYLRA